MRIFLLLCLVLAVSSCANRKLNYSAANQAMAEGKIPDLPTERPQHTVFLIGDAGNSPQGGVAEPLKALEVQLRVADANSSVVFLGNNAYPKGLVDKKSKRELAKARLQAQIETTRNFKGNPIFVPGDRDWRDGMKALKRQEKFVQKQLNKGIEEKDDWEDYFLPEDGCPGPEVIDVNKNLAIVVIDSEWYLENWDRHPEINSGCAAKSRFGFSFAFEEALRKNRNKNVIVVMHHPLQSGGRHGGYLPLRDHIFPFRALNDDLWIPLPVIGSAVPLYRRTIGLKQDLANPLYREMKAEIMRAVKKNGQYIFASAHDLSMQYIQADNQHFVVSGSGSGSDAVRLIAGSEFAYGKGGFSQMDFYEDGSAWLTFYAVDEKFPEGKVVFRKKIIENLPLAVYEEPTVFTEYENLPDSVDTQILTTPVTEKGFVHKALLGAHYRDVYIPKYKFPTLDLATFRGGMKVVKRGGGNQTNSLRLVDPDDKEWVMRAMTKDASRFIPYPFNKISGTQGIVEDNFLSTHPFAATVVAPLADAVNIYHTNPTIYYIPKQPLLGTDNEGFGGELYLVEERPDDDWRDLASFGNSKKIISTPDVVEKMIKNGKHRIDQDWVLRSRLFDNVIGDWDRHDDQWRWASFEDKTKDIKYYRPIPRDRDQPFSKYDGLVPAIARLTLPFLKQLKPYDGEHYKTKWDNYGGRQFDNTFLNELEWKDWEAQVKNIQNGLTDEVIEQAFRRQFPEPAYGLSAEEIMTKLKQRRDNLMNIARDYYAFRAKAVDVVGTEKDDLFLVKRLNDDSTAVEVYRLRNERNDLIYERIFLTDETDEIRLYGLDDDDQFFISGTVNDGILVRVIGGLGKDEFLDESYVKGDDKKTIVYDAEDEESKLGLGRETKNHITDERKFNIYNRKDFHYEYDFVMPFPILGFNPDDGLFFGTNMTITDYKFKKDPFNAVHNINMMYAFATNAFSLNYTGDFINAFGHTDFWLEAGVSTPQYVDNYFGFGNESVNDIDELDIDFYRVRRFNTRLYPAFKKRFAFDSGLVTFGPVLNGSKVERTENRLVSSPFSDVNPEVFDFQWFGGAELQFVYDNTDDINIPKSGILFDAGGSWQTNLSETDRDFTRFHADLTMYFPLDNRQNVVFATRSGVEHLIGDFEFYQAAILDGNDNFRGFRRDRFYGRTAFFHQNDLRVKVLTSRNNGVFPFSLGVTGGFDHGRVWIGEADRSDEWHYSYGGGIWIAPVDFIVLNTALFHSDEGNIFRFGVGFGF